MKKWLILIALGCAASVRAQPVDGDKAATLFDEGKRHFDIAEYGPAIASWKQSYLLSSEPLLLFNIGQAYRLSGNCAQANRFYLNYKRAVPKPNNGVELGQAMAKCVGVEPATGDTDAQPAPAEVDHPTESIPTVHVEPVPSPPPSTTNLPARVEPRPVSSRGGGLRAAGLIAGGAGIAAGVIAIISGVEASNMASTVSGQPRGTVWAGALPGDQSSGQSLQTRARIFGAISGVAIIGGGILWWFGHRAATSGAVDVAIDSHHAQVSWSCAF